MNSAPACSPVTSLVICTLNVHVGYLRVNAWRSEVQSESKEQNHRGREFISDRDECQTATNKTFLVLQSVYCIQSAPKLV